MKVRRRRKRRTGQLGARVHAAVALWIRSLRHVVTGGRTTRRRAVKAATAPPAKCPTCRQPVAHSPHPHDHYHL